MTYLPVGKLPAELLKRIIQNAPVLDNRIIAGPGIGMDCAVVENGDHYLVIKNDPITFSSENIGWYAVQINVNDIVTTGAIPKWMLATVLLPEQGTTAELVNTIASQLFDACRQLGISFIGGHTEITYGIGRPVISATLIGEVAKPDLITPCGMRRGDDILLTKGLAVEATAILAQEFGAKLAEILSADEIQAARNYIYNPGISVYKDARIAVECGGIHAMHDPTEGGLSTALWELAIASGKCIHFFPKNVTVSELTQKTCAFFGLDPLNSISSGALLICADPKSSGGVISALEQNGIPCARIGTVAEGEPAVLVEENYKLVALARPERDEISKVFESPA